jgi:hypothetical protein
VNVWCFMVYWFSSFAANEFLAPFFYFILSRVQAVIDSFSKLSFLFFFFFWEVIHAFLVHDNSITSKHIRVRLTH